ncbi:speckle-type POZ protein B-like [Oppia nitens]|uniref:speckle-type POZ protein B-like n=1 Tax=Oppia nitens TaxID=1686743 RepID=UPI0023DA767A|nr:speckle-type POZ protein B-like [Oppia nitens]
MDFAKQLDTNWIKEKCYYSDDFNIGSDKWDIEICLKDNIIGLYLHLNESNELPVHTQYSLSICDNNFNANQLFVKKEFKCRFEEITGWGNPSIITRQQLMDNRVKLLPDNTLTIVVDFKIFKKSNCHENCGAKRFRRFAQLFSLKELSNCRLIVGKDRKEFYTSKHFLCLESEVFEKMFTTDCTEKTTNEVIIDDIGSDVFEQFLKYLSTGMCDKLDEMTDQLLYVADKYMVSSLKTLCLNWIFLRINSTNAMKILKLFEDFGADEVLVKMVNDFISENIATVIVKELIEKHAISLKNMSQIVDNFGKHLPKFNAKLLYYTYSYSI